MCQVFNIHLRDLCRIILVNTFINVFLTSSWNSCIISPFFPDANIGEMTDAVWSLKCNWKNHCCNSIVSLQIFFLPSLSYFSLAPSQRGLLVQLFLPQHMPCASCFLFLSFVREFHAYPVIFLRQHISYQESIIRVQNQVKTNSQLMIIQDRQTMKDVTTVIHFTPFKSI